jgi:Zn-finger nucleic acid-binding protein
VDFIGRFFHLVGKIYTFPFHVSELEGYHYASHSKKLTIAIGSGVIIYGITAAVLMALLVWGYHRMQWRRNRQHCQHSECGHQWTTHISDDHDGLNCMPGQPCCEDCQIRHEEEAVKRRAEAEPRRQCVHGHGDMEKVIVDGDMVIDRCKICGGVWLDGDELDRIERRVRREGYDEGRHDREAANVSSAVIASSVAAGISINN